MDIHKLNFAILEKEICSLLCIKAGEKLSQREVADIAGVTEVTIRNHYKELFKRLNLKDKIKEAIQEFIVSYA